MPEIDQSRLDLLLKKERAHDDYLSALQMMRQQTFKVERKALAGENPFGRPIPDGSTFATAAWAYRRALSDMALMIIQSSAKRADEAER